MKKTLIISAGLLAVWLVLPGTLINTATAAATSTNITVRVMPADGDQIAVQQPARAAVSISGRVLFSADLNSRGLSGTTVTLTDIEGTIRTTRTNPFGYYRFTCVQVGDMYVVSVTDKRLLFEPQVIGLMEEVTGLNFVPLP
jgi:hypothetical protein